MYLSGYVTTPASPLSSRRVERNTQERTNEKEHFQKKTSGDDDDRLARRSAPLHRPRARNEKALHRPRYRHQQDLSGAHRVTQYRVSRDSTDSAGDRYARVFRDG